MNFLLCIVLAILLKENVTLKIVQDYLLNNMKALLPAFDEDSAIRHPQSGPTYWIP